MMTVGTALAPPPAAKKSVLANKGSPVPIICGSILWKKSSYWAGYIDEDEGTAVAAAVVADGGGESYPEHGGDGNRSPSAEDKTPN